ncbi:MAG TPA: YlxR family protein [Candidatus Dormibacteraeota bacterium]|nr:YlxR family protein [Candidatus Dormibacteraeota bacterium]
MGCRRSASKPELVRLVKLGGRVSLDLRGKAPGRGAYLCRDSSCWTTAERKSALERALRVATTAEDWQRLREGILT